MAALASFEAETQAREKELRERLRAEVQGLVNEAEFLESAALGRARWLGSLTQAATVLAAILCGVVAVRTRRLNLTA